MTLSRSRPACAFALQLTGSQLRIITEEKTRIYEVGVAQCTMHVETAVISWLRPAQPLTTHSLRAACNHVVPFMLQALQRSTNSQFSYYIFIMFFLCSHTHAQQCAATSCISSIVRCYTVLQPRSKRLYYKGQVLGTMNILGLSW